MSRLWGATLVSAVSCLLAGPCVPALAGAGPVHGPVVRDVPRARGTMVLIHGGGWAGPDQERQWNIDWWPGGVFREARWNTRSIDYAAGRDGLESVRAQLAEAIADAHRGRVCAYGESAGGHLALLAAAALPALRCVITLGGPTDLERWRDDAAREGNATSEATYWRTAGSTFGPGPIDAAWEPVAVADRITARVLLVGQADDEVLPIRGQIEALTAVRQTTETFLAAAGDPRDPGQHYLHGTFSPESRAEFLRRMLVFARAARRGR